MINKQGLWFLTLFSLVLVLSMYYITMPNEVFKNEQITSKSNKKINNKKIKEVNSTNTSYIETLKIELDEERTKILDTLQQIINDKTKDKDEKNKAYEEMKDINDIKAQEEQITKNIKEQYKLNAYVKLNDNNIEIIIESDKHDIDLANKIMKTVQENFNDPMNISIKFS